MPHHSIEKLRYHEHRSDAVGEEMREFYQQQMNGEQPDPDAFTALLEKKSVNDDAMKAHRKLGDGLKTVLREMK